jgi:CRP/FNR family cyclic AMP-dependent transcriptional regulator
MSVDVTALVDLPLLRELTTSELEEIALRLSVREFAPAERLIKEGDAPEHPIYILLQGSVDVLKASVQGRQQLITSLSAPSVFGEIEVLAKRPAIASVTASSAGQVAMLRRGDFDEMARQNRSCALKVIKNLAQTLSMRLAATDERLAACFDLGDQQRKDLRNLLYTGWKQS